MSQANNPLTIALVTTEYITERNFDGGLANYIHRVALCLKQLGHIPIVFVASDKNEILECQGIEIHRLKLRGNIILGIINLLTFQKINAINFLLWLSVSANFYLNKVNKVKKFSVIQYPSCAGMALFRCRSVPSIVRISGYLPMWNKAYEVRRTINMFGIEKIEDIAYARADALFAPSRLNAKAVEKAIGKPVTVIETPFIIETMELDDSIYQMHLKDKKYLLFFGTVGLMKGCGLIAEVIYDVLASDRNLYFVFVGKDTGYLGYQGVSIMDRIRENAKEYASRVIHLQPLTHQYLYPVIANAYAVVLPSRVDNFPNTCLEAMGHRKIVIGTNGASFEQLIDDGISGFLCQKDNPQNLLLKIRQVLSLTPEVKHAIEEKAYERIQELRPEKVVNQLVDFYRMVIDDFKRKKISS